MNKPKAKFSCINIGTTPFTYELYDASGVFRVKREGFPLTKKPMTFRESVEFIISDIRNQRAISYFESNPDINLKLINSFNKNANIELPEIYYPLIDRLIQAISLNKSDITVKPEVNQQFFTNSIIFLDTLFIEDIKILEDKLRG